MFTLNIYLTNPFHPAHTPKQKRGVSFWHVCVCACAWNIVRFRGVVNVLWFRFPCLTSSFSFPLWLVFLPLKLIGPSNFANTWTWPRKIVRCLSLANYVGQHGNKILGFPWVRQYLMNKKTKTKEKNKTKAIGEHAIFAHADWSSSIRPSDVCKGMSWSLLWNYWMEGERYCL